MAERPGFLESLGTGRPVFGVSALDDTQHVLSSSLTMPGPGTPPSFSPLQMNNTIGPMRTISSLRAHRGPYARPTVLDKDVRYTPYGKKPVLIRGKKVASDAPGLNLTSTAERIIQTLSKCATPVVETKKSPLDAIKSLKPEFPSNRRETSGPPTSRYAYDSSVTPERTILTPLTPRITSPRMATSTPKPPTPTSTQDFLAQIFPESEKEDVRSAAGAVQAENPRRVGNSFLAVRPEISQNKEAGSAPPKKKLLIDLDAVKFTSWSLEELNAKGDSYESSDEDEDGNPYIKCPEPGEVGKSVSQSLKKTEKFEVFRVEPRNTSTPVPTVAAAVTNGKSKWECPACMVHAPAEDAVCPCCGTDNPNPTTSNGNVKAATPQPANPPATPFKFGFSANASSASPPVSTSFKLGGQPSPTSDPSSMLTKFKQGFPAQDSASNSSNEPAKPIFPATFSFGILPSTSTSTLTTAPTTKFGFGLSSASESKKESASVPVVSSEAKVVDFAQKSAKEEVWECSECMVFNKVSQSKCVCCQNPQPKPKASTVATSTTNDTFAFGSSSWAKPNPNPPASTTSPRKIVFGLRPEDEEESLEAPSTSTEVAKPNPFAGLAFSAPSTLFSFPKPTEAPKPPANEMWICPTCTATNRISADRCNGCGIAKPRLDMGQETPVKKEHDFEKYAFSKFYGVQPDNAKVAKSEPFPSSQTPTPAPVPLSQPSIFPQPQIFGTTPSVGFSFGAQSPAPAVPAATSSAGFKFGASTATEGLKRKADDNSLDAGPAKTAGFSFGGSSEPQLKLRSPGIELPAFGGAGLKSGSVLDALKQPGFGMTQDKPDGGPAPTQSAPASTSAGFAFGTSAPVATTQAPAPGAFQFGSNQGFQTTPASQQPTFSFGGSGMNNQPNSVFGAQPSVPSMQPFGQPGPGFGAAQPPPAAFVAPEFSVTPNLNFGGPAAGNAPTLFSFSATPTPGGPSAATPQRKFRKAIRRTK